MVICLATEFTKEQCKVRYTESGMTAASASSVACVRWTLLGPFGQLRTDYAHEARSGPAIETLFRYRKMRGSADLRETGA
jgi:hypothetical protein